MSAIKIGELKKLDRDTFLYQGIFVHKGSQVKILEIDDSGVTIEYYDMEGHPHSIAGFQPEELI